MLEVVAPIRCSSALFITDGHSEIYGRGMTQMKTAVPFDASAVNAQQRFNSLSWLPLKGGLGRMLGMWLIRGWSIMFVYISCILVEKGSSNCRLEAYVASKGQT